MKTKFSFTFLCATAITTSVPTILTISCKNSLDEDIRRGISDAFARLFVNHETMEKAFSFALKNTKFKIDNNEFVNLFNHLKVATYNHVFYVSDWFYNVTNLDEKILILIENGWINNRQADVKNLNSIGDLDIENKVDFINKWEAMKIENLNNVVAFLELEHDKNGATSGELKLMQCDGVVCKIEKNFYNINNVNYK